MKAEYLTLAQEVTRTTNRLKAVIDDAAYLQLLDAAVATAKYADCDPKDLDACEAVHTACSAAYKAAKQDKGTSVQSQAKRAALMTAQCAMSISDPDYPSSFAGENNMRSARSYLIAAFQTKEA